MEMVERSKMRPPWLFLIFGALFVLLGNVLGGVFLCLLKFVIFGTQGDPFFTSTAIYISGLIGTAAAVVIILRRIDVMIGKIFDDSK